jgi:hypothetical protein
LAFSSKKFLEFLYLFLQGNFFGCFLAFKSLQIKTLIRAYADCSSELGLTMNTALYNRSISENQQPAFITDVHSTPLIPDKP